MSYNPDNSGLRNVASNDALAVGTTPVLCTTSLGTERSVIIVSNAAAFTPVYLKYVPRSAAVPTISATNYHEFIDTGEFTPKMGLSKSIAVWAWAASSTTVEVVEMGY